MSPATKRRPILVAIVVAIFGVIALVTVTSEDVAAAEDPSKILSSSTVRVKRDENWLQAQIRKFRTFPHLDRAYRLIGRGRLADAQAELEDYLAIDPLDARVRMTYVSVLYRSKNYPSVVRQVEVVLKEQHGLSDALLYRGMAFQALGQYDNAFVDFQVVAAKPDTTAEARLFATESIANIALRRGKYSDALAALDQLAATRSPPLVQYRRGVALEALGRLEDADAAYRSALKEAMEADDKIRILHALGNLASKRGDWKQAQADFSSGLKLDADNPELLLALARAAYAGKDSAKAVEWARRAVEARSNPKDREFLANLLLERKEFHGAIAQYAELLNSCEDPQQEYRIDMSLGFAYTGLAQHPQAVKYFRRATKIRREPAALSALAQSLEQSGQKQEAIRTWQEVVNATPSAKTHVEHVIRNTKPGEDAHAVLSDEQVAVSRGIPEAHFRLGMLYDKIGDNAKALHHLKAATSGNLPSGMRKTAYLQVAYLNERIGNHQDAVKAFRQAIESGLDGRRIQSDLGLALLNGERAEEALPHLRAAYEEHPTAIHAVYVSRCLQRLHQTEEARHFLNKALAGRDKLEMPMRKKLLDELGFLYSEDGDYANAADTWSRSLALKGDAATAMRLARVQRTLGKLDEAERALKAVNASELSNKERVTLADEFSQVYRDLGRFSEAIDSLRQANALKADAEREYQIGLLEAKLERGDAAIFHFEAAASQAPSAAYYAELAYAYKRAGRLKDAAKAFETAAQFEPKRAGIDQDLAYAYLASGENDKAEYWFKRAIDRRSASLDGSPQDQGSLGVDTYDLQREVSKLTHRYGLTYYQSYRSHGGTPGGSAGTSVGGVIPSQGGMEFVFQPPGIGFRDERIFQLFGRLLWTNHSQSLAIDRNTVQGGIGARYKPLKGQNLFFSAERLVKIGDRADEDWLLRGSYGWSDGDDLKPGRRAWKHTLLYGDVGYFARRQGTLAYYAELRQGMTFNVNNRLLVTPHVTLVGRQQRPDPFDSSYVEGGAGVSLRYLFNATRYEPPRSSLEFLLQYKSGISPTTNGGWVLTSVMRF